MLVGIRPRALTLLGKYSTIELHLQLNWVFSSTVKTEKPLARRKKEKASNESREKRERHYK